MALKTTWEDAGDGVILSSNISSRTFRVDGSEGYFELWYEETLSETRKWYAFTETAAQTPIDENGQPEDPDATYSWGKQCTSTVIGSYDVERTYTRIRKTLVENGDLPSPTFDPEGEAIDGRQDMHTSALSVDITSEADTKVWYRIGQWVGGAAPSGYFVFGDWTENIDNTATVSLSPNNTYSDPYYRLVRVEAYARKLVGDVYVVSGTTLQDYRDDLVVEPATFSPEDGTQPNYHLAWNNENISFVATAAAGQTIQYVWEYWNGTSYTTRSSGVSSSNTLSITITPVPGINGTTQQVRTRTWQGVGGVNYLSTQWFQFNCQMFIQAGP